MDDDLILFTLAQRRGHDRLELRRMLHAHITCGEAHEIGEWLLRGMTLISITVWVAALWPQRIPTSLRSLALDLWAAGCLALVVAVIVEQLCRRLRARCLEELSPATTQGERCDALR